MMTRDSLDTTLILLIGLSLATSCASWDLFAAPFVDAAVLVIAALKGRRILLDFLGLRVAPAVWRGLVTAWVLGVALFAWVLSAIPLVI